MHAPNTGCKGSCYKNSTSVFFKNHKSFVRNSEESSIDAWKDIPMEDNPQQNTFWRGAQEVDGKDMNQITKMATWIYLLVKINAINAPIKSLQKIFQKHFQIKTNRIFSD